MKSVVSSDYDGWFWEFLLDRGRVFWTMFLDSALAGGFGLTAATTPNPDWVAFALILTALCVARFFCKVAQLVFMTKESPERQEEESRLFLLIRGLFAWAAIPALWIAGIPRLTGSSSMIGLLLLVALFMVGVVSLSPKISSVVRKF